MREGGANTEREREIERARKESTNYTMQESDAGSQNTKTPTALATPYPDQGGGGGDPPAHAGLQRFRGVVGGLLCVWPVGKVSCTPVQVVWPRAPPSLIVLRLECACVCVQCCVSLCDCE